MRKLVMPATRTLSDHDDRMSGVRLSDPCAYCGRPLAQVATDGCGSQEFIGMSQEQRDALCEVYERVRRNGIAREMREPPD